MSNLPNNLFGTPTGTGIGGVPGGFSFGSPRPATTAASTTSGLGTGGFSFGGGTALGGGTSGGLPFGSVTPFTTTTAAPAAPAVGFSFSAQPGAASTTSNASTGGFSLGTGVKPVGSGFSFGSIQAAPAAVSTFGTSASTGSFTHGTVATAPSMAAPGGFSFASGIPSATTAAAPLNLGGAPTLGGAPAATTMALNLSGAPPLGRAPPNTTAAPGGFSFAGGASLGGAAATSGGFSLSGAAPALTTTGGFSMGSTKPVGFGVPTATVATTAPLPPASAAVAAASTANQGFAFSSKTATATATTAGYVPGSGTLGSLGTGTLGTGSLGTGTLGTLGTLGMPATTSSTPGGGLSFGATAVKSSEGLGSLLGKPATTSTTRPASTGLTLGLSSGTSALTATPSTSIGQSLGGLGATALKAPTTTTTATAAPTASQGPMLSYHQLEQAINKWTVQLEDQEKMFLTQATQVNAWDRILIQNGEMITTLHSDLEKVKTDQQRLEHELDFIMAQQRELEDMLVPLEDAVRTQQQGTVYSQHADSERERTYVLAENIDCQLTRMVQDLKEIIEHLNTANAPQDTTDPISQIVKILNAHMDSLQWIDQNTVMLQRKVDEVSKQSEMVRRDQEKNVHLAFD